MPGMIGRASKPYDRAAVPCRLLLVSDRQAASEALRTHLAHHGFTIVAHEGSATGAADAACREHPDVVLIDAAVPGGWQDVVAALDDLVPRDHIAVLAAYWSTDARRAATRTGIGATLLKRVEGVELVNRLRAVGGVA
jgi:DNA-binding NarL/FixJ family response regulator